MIRTNQPPVAPIFIRRIGVVSAIGHDFASFTAALNDAAPVPVDGPVRGVQIAPADYLGRSGLAMLDRMSQMAMVACLDALGSCDGPRDRTGIVMGTSGGSWESICAFVRSTYEGSAPHMVSPAKFPNVVLNCAAAQSAIRFGLTGINSTVCAGDLSAFSAIAYAVRALRLDYADVLLAGGIEEYCDHTAASHAVCSTDDRAIGEGVAVFALSRASDGAIAEVLGVRQCRAGDDAVGRARRARAIAGLLADAGIVAHAVDWAMVSGDGPVAESEHAALTSAGCAAMMVDPLGERRLGRTYAASFAFQLAAAIAAAPSGIGVLTTADEWGQFGCALVRVPGRRGAKAVAA